MLKLRYVQLGTTLQESEANEMQVLTARMSTVRWQLTVYYSSTVNTWCHTNFFIPTFTSCKNSIWQKIWGSQNLAGNHYILCKWYYFWWIISQGLSFVHVIFVFRRFKIFQDCSNRPQGACKNAYLGKNPQESPESSWMFETSLIRVFHQLASDSLV